LQDILTQRIDGDLPIIMSDASSMNNVKGQEYLKALCNVHSRRTFFDLGEKFKEESSIVLNLFTEIYKNERTVKEQALDDMARLDYHQKNSLPLMIQLRSWMDSAIDEKKTEPNSSVGMGIKYCQKHWEHLLAFTKIPGAPLDNNLIEEKLRLPVLNRKNSLFFKTMIGALVGDIILSMIKSAEETEVNIFDYLVWIQENKIEVKKNPEKFFPWNFVGSSPV
jgi:hypothetical protein